MRTEPPQRKILIIENDRDIRNVLYVLLAGIGWECEIAHDTQQALSKISREEFDTVLLDLHCSNDSPEQVVSQIKAIRPSLVGRVLVITGDVTSPEVLKAIERQCLPQVRRGDVISRLLEVLKSLF